MRLLVTGASGFLGWNLVRLLPEDFQLTGTYCRNQMASTGADTLRLDITDSASISQALQDKEFDVLVHAAALTSPDVCEKDPERALKTNVDGTAHLARWARDAGVLFVYISTDLIFDGRKGWYRETDPPNPLNTYGRSKLRGEEAVQALCRDWIILRPSIFYGWGTGASRSFVDWLLQNWQKGQKIGLFRDQYRTFLYVGDFARGLKVLLARRIRNEIFHIGGRDRLSRVDFGERFARQFGFSTDLIEPISIRDLSNYAARGLDCSLNTDRLEQLGFRPGTLHEGLDAMKEDPGSPI